MSIGTRDEPQAVLHDIRYSRFEGELRPRWAAVWALARSTAGRALGLRRSAGAKIWPFLLVAGCFIPAIVAVGVPLLLNEVGIDEPEDVLEYADLLDAVTPLVVAYAASVVPSMLTRERRDGVLSLYFSTALAPLEYVIGKVISAVMVLALIVLGPLMLLWVGGILVAKQPLDTLGNDIDQLPRILVAALVVCLFHAALALGLGAATPRRVFAVGGYVALMLVPSVLFGILFGITENGAFLSIIPLALPVLLAREVLGQPIVDGNPEEMPVIGVSWVAWVVVVVIGFGAMALRYRKGSTS